MRNRIRIVTIIFSLVVISTIISFLYVLNNKFNRYDVNIENNGGTNRIEETPTTSISANGTIWRDIKENALLSMNIRNDIGIIICNALNGEWDDLPITENFKKVYNDREYYDYEKLFPGYNKNGFKGNHGLGSVTSYDTSEYNNNIIIFPLEIEEYVKYKFRFKFVYTKQGELDDLIYIDKVFVYDKREENLRHMNNEQWNECLLFVLFDNGEGDLWSVCALTDHFIKKHREKGIINTEIGDWISNSHRINYDKSSLDNGICYIVSRYKNKDDSIKDLKYKEYAISFKKDDRDYLDEAEIVSIKDVTEEDYKNAFYSLKKK